MKLRNCSTPPAPLFLSRIVYVFGISDELKPDAEEAVACLQSRGIKVVMLMGDNQRTASAVARDLGIGQVYAQVVPAQKAQKIKNLQNDGLPVAMVGRHQ